jgi:alpha-glucosidase (family GH31 glycosyl hydrolase)
MSESVVSVMMNGIMGVSLPGSPICGTQGFRGSTVPDEALCLKWYHLGALYPMSRLFVDEHLSYPNDPF